VIAMNTPPAPGALPHDTGSQGQSRESAPALNVERLADVVYDLMLADVRLEQARAGATKPRG
jgi:hypothetical protein